LVVFLPAVDNKIWRDSSLDFFRYFLLLRRLRITDKFNNFRDRSDFCVHKIISILSRSVQEAPRLTYHHLSNIFWISVLFESALCYNGTLFKIKLTRLPIVSFLIYFWALSVIYSWCNWFFSAALQCDYYIIWTVPRNFLSTFISDSFLSQSLVMEIY
jgi:hypothetical protein